MIDTSALLSSPNAASATRLSRELYVIFGKKTVINTKARFELQNLRENQGLEALRLIRMNLCKREGQRSQDEYEVGTTLPKIKEGDMGNLVSLLRRWESEINKFEAIDKGYSPGIFQRRNWVYRALPEAAQKDVDKEVAKSELASYESFMDCIRNLSRSARYQKQAAPRPLTANIIEGNPGPMASTWQSESPSNSVYSVDEWSEWLQVTMRSRDVGIQVTFGYNKISLERRQTRYERTCERENCSHNFHCRGADAGIWAGGPVTLFETKGAAGVRSAGTHVRVY